jgi:4-amino-4-deoxy-L-arabinose transferase-like glycosyltransferase
MRKFAKWINKLKSLYLLFFILLLSSALNYIFFIGFVNSAPQDDAIYLGNAKDILDGHFSFNKNLLNEKYANPVEVIHLRVFFNYIVAFFQYLFGVNNFSSSLFSLISNLGIVILIYLIGNSLCNKNVGLFSAFTISIIPHFILFSSRILPDLPMLFFMTLSVYLFLNAKKNQKKYILSGISWGIAYIIKEYALILVFFYLSYFIYKRKIPKEIIFVIIGFIFIFSLESLYFYYNTGSFLYKNIIWSKVHNDKYFEEYKNLEYKSFNLLGLNLNFIYPQDYDFLYHLRRMFLENHDLFGGKFYSIFYYVMLVGIIYLFLKRSKKLFLISLWFLLTYLFIEFGFLDLSFSSFSINYFLTFKEADSFKMILPVLLPLSLLIGLFLSNLWNSKNRYFHFFPLILIFFMLIFSIQSISSIKNFLYDGIKDIKEAKEFLQPYIDSGTFVYTDYLGRNELYYFFGYKKGNNLRNIYEISDFNKLNNSIIIEGGARGVDIVGEYVNSLYPYDVKNSTFKQNWIMIKSIEGKKTFYRLSDMVFYYFP